MSKAKFRIKVEERCEECIGEGTIYYPANSPLTCSDCDGEGYVEVYVSLKDLLILLTEEK